MIACDVSPVAMFLPLVVCFYGWAIKVKASWGDKPGWLIAFSNFFVDFVPTMVSFLQNVLLGKWTDHTLLHFNLTKYDVQQRRLQCQLEQYGYCASMNWRQIWWQSIKWHILCAQKMSDSLIITMLLHCRLL